MTESQQNAAVRKLSHRRFAERRGVSTKTLDRWVVLGILPPPERINGRKYWNEETEPRRDGEAATQ
jgi:DNA-binding transcriptional MerR regulator